jgi:glycosyltransferase involved in cell wall biosynthesis
MIAASSDVPSYPSNDGRNASGAASGQKLDFGRGPVVLLFYDGFEMQARRAFWAKAHSALRGKARYAYRRAKGLQVYTGFYVAFRLLVRCLQDAGCDVRINDFKLADRYPDYPIGLCGYPSVLDKVKLKNPAIFGPGDYGFPDQAAERSADHDIRRYIQPCKWAASLYDEALGDKMMIWPVGIDTEACPDFIDQPKDIDVLIYDKIRWNRQAEVPRVVEPIAEYLRQTGKRVQILQYGNHHYRQYVEALRRSRALLFLCEHETQGIAYQEALASNVPVLAWDEGVLVDPLQRTFAADGLVVSSVPYFDERCGERFKLGDFRNAFEKFWARLPSYEPRRYIASELSLKRSAEKYLEAYWELSGSECSDRKIASPGLALVKSDPC